MGNLFPATWDWYVFWSNTALISLILAFMNILPIPALDGGQIILFIIEINKFFVRLILSAFNGNVLSRTSSTIDFKYIKLKCP